MNPTYAKRKRVTSIFKKYSTKKAKSSYLPPMRYFEQKTKVFGAGTLVATTGNIIPLDLIAAGVGRDDRQGNKVTFNSFDCKFKITANAAGAASVLVRMMIVVDTQQVIATSPTLSQILESDVISGEGLDRRGRFKVLFDRTVICNLSGDNSKYVAKNVKCNVVTEWNNNTAGGNMKNGVTMLLLSDQAANTPTVAYNVRSNFTDW